MNLRSICVFLGSSQGINPIYKQAVIQLGKEIAKRQIKLVYGGTNIGLMNDLANSVLEEKGHVTGVIIEDFEGRGVSHKKLSQSFVMKNLKERLDKMIELSDAYIVFPGGIGSIHELYEVWVQFRAGLLKPKPIGLLNINNFFKDFISFQQLSVDEGFTQKEHLDLLLSQDNASNLIDALELKAENTCKKAKSEQITQGKDNFFQQPVLKIANSISEPKKVPENN